VHLDVPRAQGGRAECVGGRVERVAGGDDGSGVDDAAAQEADRLRPDTRRANDALDPQRPGLDQAQFGRDGEFGFPDETAAFGLQ
jgi:hypothetical protein